MSYNDVDNDVAVVLVHTQAEPVDNSCKAMCCLPHIIILVSLAS